MTVPFVYHNALFKKCPLCGQKATVDAPEPIYHRCVSEERGSPGWLARLDNFRNALAAHIAAGMPTCSQQQIDERFAICESCSLFNGSICRHASCGCNVGRQDKFLNKLAWADQSCPLGKWSALTAAHRNPDVPGIVK